MSEPEIARRCSACGISLRQTALYCPQCGRKTGDSPFIDDSPTEPVDFPPTAPANTTAQPAASPIGQNPSTVSPASHAHGLTGVADNVRERVEKFKHVSSVMIDQAAYDPSLRFLLVAAVLFVLFLVLLILSKVIG